MRFPILLLLFCGSLLLSGTDCDWKMPEATASCTQKIKWKVHNNNQATATCLEYFPTTYVDGVIDQSNKDVIICTVYRQFECQHVRESVVIFDKCYKFDTVNSALFTIPQYQAARDTMCPGEGGLPVLLTMTQAKHVAKAAHKRGIVKMWANLDKDGRTIDKTYSLGETAGTAEGFLLYRNPWKVHHASHWNGDKLVKTPKKGDDFVLPTEAKYLFFRTNTDYVNNMWQGSFEHATDATKASVVCEYQAKAVPDLEKYCGKMQKLGMKAKYDNRDKRKRCLYPTLSAYPLQGTEAAIRSFTACNEKPSEGHSAGLDDGTASAVAYSELTSAGAHRIAAVKMDTSISHSSSYNNYAQGVRGHCDQRSFSQAQREKHRQPYKIYPHFKDEDFTRVMQVEWEYDYPKDECTDFPNEIKSMHSNGLAIRKGKIIDVPTPVHLPALCSIVTNVDCKLHEDKANDRNVCGGDGPARYDMKCEDVEEWNPATMLYAKCSCLPLHTGNECDWSGGSNSCGGVKKYGDAEGDSGFLEITKNVHQTFQGGYSDHVNRVVVRKGCTAWIFSHPTDVDWESQKVTLLEGLTVGDYPVPQHESGTLRGWESGMSASAYKCQCP